MSKGLFIVIEGTDGSGKSTQLGLLVERLKQRGLPVATFDFPQYGQPSAYFVEQYLNGNYGDLDSVSPRKGSLFYALDRFEASFKIRKALDAGTIVLANRYVGSNMAHQGSKFASDYERRKYFEWLNELEFDTLGIPRPDLNIVLRVPAAIAQKLVDQKGRRDYLGGAKRDIHEDDLEHLQKSEQVYLEMCRIFPQYFTLIECMNKARLMTAAEIGELVWLEVTKKL